MPDYSTVTTTSVSSGTRIFISPPAGQMHYSVVNDPDNWALSDGDRLTAEKLNRAFMPTPEFFTAKIARPNALRRLLWKWALGVEWKDLRGEQKLKALGELK